jgi:hypothetical protein
MTITEGTTPATGTEVTPVARHRGKVATSALTLHNTAVSAATTVLDSKAYPASTQGGSGIISDGIEWVLAQDKSYTIVVTNNGAQTSTGYLSIDWYEETAF